jgi:capsular polysaccharide biosynthesis protein
LSISGFILGLSKQLVLPVKRHSRKLPVNLADNEEHFHANRFYDSPDLYLYSFKTAYLLPDSTLFLLRFWPLKISFPFFRGRIIHHSVKGLLDIQRKWRVIHLKEIEVPYVVIHDQWTLNYYHWMTQALPRLLMVLQHCIEFKLLLPASHSRDYHQASLRLLGVTDWTIVDDGQVFWKVHHLIYPAHDIQIGDYHDDLIHKLASRLRVSIRSSNVGISRIFVHRKSATRKITNEQEVLDVFKQNGFKIISFETLSFLQQIETAAGASVLAGVHGAGLTNMIFMKEGSSVLELTTQLNGDQYYYYTLANALKHNYYYQLCSADSNIKSIQEADLTVDVALLRQNLSKMLYS